MKPVTAETIRRLSVTVNNNKQEESPNFSVNLMNKKLLYAIIMGNIVLPRKNPILVDNMQNLLEKEISEGSFDHITKKSRTNEVDIHKSIRISSHDMVSSPPNHQEDVLKMT
jgi:hypothetical protein